MLLNHKHLKIALCAFTLILGAATLTACESAKSTLGLEKQAPDEFAVLKRAPLELPPDYSLRPPRPGTPRPQEQEPVNKAREVVFGEQTAPQASQPSNPEESLLLKAGAAEVDPDIRAKVDRESTEYVEDNRPAAQKLLDLVNSDDTPPAVVVDPKAEAERIRENSEKGRPINEGETPTIRE